MEDKVKKYWNFDETAEEFDEIYDNGGGAFKRLVNKIFRKGMAARVSLTLKECDGQAKTILDIGCGSGRIALLLAEKGMKVAGIDYSSKMIELANLRKNKVKSGLNVEFRQRDFMKDFESNELFDITLAIIGVLPCLFNFTGPKSFKRGAIFTRCISFLIDLVTILSFYLIQWPSPLLNNRVYPNNL